MTTETPTTPAGARPRPDTPPPPGPRHAAEPAATGRSRGRSVLKHTLVIVVAALMLYPLLWMIVSSLRPETEIFARFDLVLNTFDPTHYPEGWNALSQPFGSYLLNSAIVVLGAIIGNLVACSMAAYAFARLDFPYRRTAFALMLLTIMLPIHIVIVPQYVLFAQADVINTFIPLVLPKLLATDAFFIFLMVQFIRGIPRELDEAARIDGAGHGRIFLRIILPLMVPALATTAVFTFIWTWNDFFTQLIFLTDPNLYTVPVALRSFIDAQSESSFGSLFAMSVVSLLPVFLAFLVGQRFLVRGIATTGGK